MSAPRRVTATALDALAARLVDDGTRIVAPVPHGPGLEYAAVAEGVALDAAAPLPRRSLKEFFLPPTEALVKWTRTPDGTLAKDAFRAAQPTVVLGARACDAAALPILDRVMGWDYRDDAWFARREATLIVTLACGAADGACFCEAVGLAPDAAHGSDVLLTPVAGDDEGRASSAPTYLVEAVSSKGESFVVAHADVFTPAGEAEAAAAATFRAAARAKAQAALAKQPKVDPAAVRAKAAAHFEDGPWAEIARRCHGCGACAFVCPTCHCFDIVDEPEGQDGGTRRRNWDTCQAGKFTLHASGHNPRPDQGARYRQRVLHKFSVYPEKFDAILCTGCGRCSRTCPAGMNLPEVLARVAETP